MTRRGLSKWIRGPEAVPGPSPEGATGRAGTPAADLELEKRWLQLVAVDSEQFRAFYDKYHDPLYRFIAHHVGDAERAQDLTQDVFIYALEHLDRFKWQGYSFGAWLFHIARQRVLTRHWRRPDDGPVAPPPTDDDEVADAGADQAGDLERAELRGRVRELMQRFPDERYDVFVLSVFMEWSDRDTALALGMKPSTVRSHLTRGRAQLAEWLRDEAALTDDERLSLSRSLAAGQGLDVMPTPRGSRTRLRDDVGRDGVGRDNDGRDDDGHGDRMDDGGGGVDDE